jgi:hypothetical protein
VLTLEDAATMAMALPDVIEGERWRHRTWLVAGKGFAWERPLSKADVKRFGDEPIPQWPIMAIRVADLNEKEAVLAANHRGFFTIQHFDGYPAVLIELRHATKKPVREALLDGWLACAPTSLAEAHFPKRG